MKSFCVWLGLACAAIGQVPEYLPLQLGNQWIYRASLGPQQVVSVSRLETVGGNTYAVLTGFFDETWLRATADGVLVRYDREARVERPYLDFTAREGVSYPTSAHPCNTTALTESKTFQGKFPLGEFGSVFAIRYTGNPVCADSGLAADYYLPYIGLLRRTEITIAGPRSYDLTYARINGTVMISTAETSFSVSTDKPVYLISTADVPAMSARMTLRTDEDLTLEFSSGQEIDYVLRNSEGKEVFRWSATRTFVQGLKTLRVRKEHNWTASIPLTDADGKALPPGTYQLDGFLTTTAGARYRGVVTIELTATRPDPK